MINSWNEKVLWGHKLPRTIYKEYCQVTSISRTVHMNQYRKTVELDDFFPQAVTEKHGTKLRLRKSLWFRALDSTCHVENHDWFGNVRMSLDPITLLSMDGIHLFIVDFIAYVQSAATRILITKRSSWPNSTKVNIEELMPGDLFFIENNEMLYASAIEVKGRTIEHRLHFVIDASTVETKNLFKECTIEAVNHSHVNDRDYFGKYKNHQCLIYNNGLLKDCPYMSNVEETQIRIEVMNKKKIKSKAKKSDIKRKEMKFYNRQTNTGYCNNKFAILNHLNTNNELVTWEKFNDCNTNGNDCYTKYIFFNNIRDLNNKLITSFNDRSIIIEPYEPPHS